MLSDWVAGKGTCKRKVYVLAPRQIPVPLFPLLVRPGAAEDTTVEQCLGLANFLLAGKLVPLQMRPSCRCNRPLLEV